jgi:1-phosphatidylinositol-4-phosphate 5-kinase
MYHPDIGRYISAHPDTFLTKFVGCHALTMYGKTMFFIVMQSVFDTPLAIHERFDLKGRTNV